MPDLAEAAVKHLHLPIPLKKGVASEHISSIEIEDIHVSIAKDSPRPSITGFITTFLHIPRALKHLKFVTTGIQAEFYLLLPGTSTRIARLVTGGWQESSSGQQEGKWKIEARVKDAPVEICNEEGFDKWIRMMMEHEGDMKVSVEGCCTAAIKALGASLQLQKLPVTACLNLPGKSSYFHNVN